MRLWLLVLLFVIPLGGFAGDIPENFKRENLVAWCIVPFDAKKRGPEARAQMVKDLGLKRIAYDWRKEHIPSFEQEILAYKKHGLEMFAFWGGHEEAFALFEKYQIRPQVWRTLRAPDGDTQEEKVQSAAAAMESLAKRTGEMGCELGLYNHGGWGGEPKNLVAVCEELRRRGHDHVGIVYNFHHAHEHFTPLNSSIGHYRGWEMDFEKIKPYLLCLNLNGMVSLPLDRGVEGKEPKKDKILTIGRGAEEGRLIESVIRIGYDGPIGILDHRNETDSAETLRENIEGLTNLLAEE
jgi:hypothetical protein